MRNQKDLHAFAIMVMHFACIGIWMMGFISVFEVVWCGVVWCGVVWCGVVWCGVVREGMRVFEKKTNKKIPKKNTVLSRRAI
jgi:hypothetical protein